MHLWLLFLAGTTVYGISRVSEPDLEAVNFAQPIHGRKLTGNVIWETDVDSEDSCSFECVDEEKCWSYNFELSKNKTEGFKCQLSNSDRFVGIANFTWDENFNYVGIQSACEVDSSTCGDKEVCIPNYQDDSARCICVNGYTGTPCKPKSCAQLFQDGFASTGVYTINPDGGKAIPVLCDMTTGDGGWTVFQRRLDGSVDFYLNWTSYKNGFGDLKGEFWLGNDNLHRLTAAGDVKLRVDLEDFDGNIAYAEYTTFVVADEGDEYRLLIGGFTGTDGDSMSHQNGAKFSTKDSDNDNKPNESCAIYHHGAWWYTGGPTFAYCHNSNLNGKYGGYYSASGVVWQSFRGFQYSLKRTEMKIRSKS